MEETSLFKTDTANQPLAARIRPKTIDDIIGQGHLLGEGRILRRFIENDTVPSMIFWGPPGVGKTTLARVIAGHTKASFVDFSAVTGGIKEIRHIMQKADENTRYGEKTILFVDEIHRFNKAQQDAFLPFVEKGSIVLIGATTENPSFEINGALLSRCKVFVLHALTTDDIKELLKRALAEPEGFGTREIRIDDDLLGAIALFADGDGRSALSTLEMAMPWSSQKILLNSVYRKNLFYMIKKEKNITILFRLSINQCETPMPMHPYTGWPECWRPARILFMWPDELFDLQLKMWDWLIRGPWK